MKNRHDYEKVQSDWSVTHHCALNKFGVGCAATACWLLWIAVAAAQPTNGVLLSIERGSNALSLIVPSAAGQTNFLEVSDSLSAPHWLPTHVIQGTGEVQTVNLSPQTTQQFFRLAGPRKSSLDLINEALQRGDITAESAMIYRVYVLFHDDRLPTIYKGDDTGLGHFPALDEAAAAFSTLSSNAQAILQPFFIPPAYVGSWAARYQTNGAPPARRGPPPDTLIGWTNASGLDVRVWYRTLPPGMITPQAAQQALLDAEYIWTQLYGLFGVKPVSDQGQVGDGGDGRLDIYVFEDSVFQLQPIPFANDEAGGLTVPWPTSTCDGPRFILIQPSELNRCNLAHEICHAFVTAFPLSGNDCSAYRWLNEATATWAEDFVYHTDSDGNKCEHLFAPDYLEAWDQASSRFRVELPLDSSNPSLLPYGHYVFLFYTANAAGGAPVIANIWRNCQNQQPLAAINSAVPSGLDRVWPNFAMANLNNSPVDYYFKWDYLNSGASTRAARAAQGPASLGMDSQGTYSVVNLQGQSQLIYQLDSPVEYMAAVYYRFVFRDSNARSVAFYNPFADPRETHNPHVAVKVMYNVEGQATKQDDWTYVFQKNFCRDLKAERINDLIVIISNSDWQNKQPLTKVPILMANNIGCYKWNGEAVGSASFVQAATGIHLEVNFVVPSLTFELLHPEIGTWANQVFQIYQKITAPGFQWDSMTEFPPLPPNPGCTCTIAPASYQTDGGADGSITINNFVVPGVSYPSFMLDPDLADTPRACRGQFSGQTDTVVQGTGCPDPCPGGNPSWSVGLPFDPNLTSVRIGDDGAISDYETMTVSSGGTENDSQRVTFHSVPQ